VDDCPEFVSDCRVRLATDLIAHQWDPVVLSALRLGGRLRADLLTSIGGISDKALTEALRRLTGSGLVQSTRSVTGRRVTYALTTLGESLVNGPMAALGQWAVEHGDLVVSAQHDAR
jgi:DNA-binding HxlR family transcriptional regulator